MRTLSLLLALASCVPLPDDYAGASDPVQLSTSTTLVELSSTSEPASTTGTSTSTSEVPTTGEPAGCSSFESYRCTQPGGLFGPCVENECDPGLLCFTAKEGDLCVPPLKGMIDVNDPQVEECAAQVGVLLCHRLLGWCTVECVERACQCGWVCDDHTQFCVWSDD